MSATLMNMSFADIYQITTSDPSKSTLTELGTKVEPGQYNHGEITICSSSPNQPISLQNWQWLLGDACKVLAYTPFGDFFVWNSRDANCYMVFVQHGSTELICADLDMFINGFLTSDEVRNAVLHLKDFYSLMDSGCKIEYGQCYILVPWPILGGSDTLENYEPGDFAIYLDLVGQTLSTL